MYFCENCGRWLTHLTSRKDSDVRVLHRRGDCKRYQRHGSVSSEIVANRLRWLERLSRRSSIDARVVKT